MRMLPPCSTDHGLHRRPGLPSEPRSALQERRLFAPGAKWAYVNTVVTSGYTAGFTMIAIAASNGWLTTDGSGTGRMSHEEYLSRAKCKATRPLGHATTDDRTLGKKTLMEPTFKSFSECPAHGVLERCSAQCTFVAPLKYIFYLPSIDLGKVGTIS